MLNKLAKIEDWPGLAAVARYQAHRLADALAVTLRSLQRFFRERFGKPVQEQLDLFRQSEIERRARDGTPAKVLAVELYFKHVSHLSRQFKKFHGMSFRVWLKRVLRSASHQPRGFVSIS